VTPRTVLTVIFAAVFPFIFTSPSGAQTSITWTNLVNASVNGEVLEKTAGCDGCQDAGATSVEQLSTDGYVEFTVGELNTMWSAGLSHGNDDTTYSDIDFGFRFNGAGYADILENGIYAGGDTTYAPGDVFRISIANGRVEYSQNGRYLTESARVPQMPLLLDSSLLSMGATIRSAVIAVAPPPPAGRRLYREGWLSPATRPPESGTNSIVPARRRCKREVHLPRAVQHGRRPTDERERLRRRR
jgi:hypothetical protein